MTPRDRQLLAHPPYAQVNQSFPRPMRAIATRIFRGLVLSLIEVYILLFTGWKDEEQCSARPYRYNEAQR